MGHHLVVYIFFLALHLAAAVALLLAVEARALESNGLKIISNGAKQHHISSHINVVSL